MAEKCYNESRTGSYNIPEMLLEAQESNRLTHGDFVSEDVKMDFGRNGLRGLFASRDIPAGTLIIAEKAIFSIFFLKILTVSKPSTTWSSNWRQMILWS